MSGLCLETSASIGGADEAAFAESASHCASRGHSRSSISPSSTFQIHFQNTPVASIATWVQPSVTSQSRKLSSSAVVVAKVRTSLLRCPWASGWIRQATILVLLVDLDNL